MRLFIKILILNLFLFAPISVFALENTESRLGDIEEDGIYWQKSTWKEFAWKTIEPEEGEFDWKMTDALVKKRQKNNQIIVPRIMPFTN